MLLQQRINDIRALTRILRNGWDGHRIFIKPINVDDESFFEDLDLDNDKYTVYDGWYTIIHQLGDLIGLEMFFGSQEGKAAILKTSPDLVHNLLLEAEAFLKLVNAAV